MKTALKILAALWICCVRVGQSIQRTFHLRKRTQTQRKAYDCYAVFMSKDQKN